MNLLSVNLAGWFPTKNRIILGKLVREHNIKTVCEVGCFVGLTTIFFAELGCDVVAVDTFDAIKNVKYLNGRQKAAAKHQEQQFKSNIFHFGLEHKVDILKETSLTASMGFPDREFDLVYIDASHKYEDVWADIRAWYPKTKKILCGDGYSKPWPGVRKAVDKCGLEINKGQRVWYCIKR